MRSENQWEGFEALNDQEEKTIHFPNERFNLNLEKHQQFTRKKKKHVHPHNLTHLDQNPTQSTPNASEPHPEGFPPPLPESSHRQKQQKIPTTKVSGKIEPKLLKRMRYLPIPIIYDSQITQMRGKVVYRGLMPRTADNYFRLLKEVSWKVPLEVKKGSRAAFQFNSRFEGGNLASACQEYDLYMRFDTNTNGHMQWFYFSVRNNKKCTVKFNVFRFRKCYSLFQRGFRPYVRSRRGANDWIPGGERVKYYREMTVNENGTRKPTNFFYLSFNYTFDHQHDQVFFAACIPYTVTYLEERLGQLQANFTSQEIKYEVSPLCTTVCGQQVDMITFEPKEAALSSLPRQFIIINARSHPGQTSGSWVADGLLEDLLTNTAIHEWMLKGNICFRIIPMLNKDGVFIGNYRTGIVGDDFNRRFKSGQKEFFPQIAGLKRLVQRCQKFGRVKLFLDLHGHSIQKNSFIFGPNKSYYSHEQLIRLGDILAETSKFYSSASSIYKNQKGKIETARVYFQLQAEILSLTCENSLGLYSDQLHTYQQTSSDWKVFGAHLLQAIKIGLETALDNHSVHSHSFKKEIPLSKASRTIECHNQTKREKSRHKNMHNEVIKKKRSMLMSPKKTSVCLGFNRQTLLAQGSEHKEGKSKLNYQLPWTVCKNKVKEQQKERRLKQHRVHETALEKSIILTRYPQCKSIDEGKSLLEMKASRTVHQQSASMKYSMRQQELAGEEEQLPENFSQGNQSFNDLDTQEDDIPQSKRQELFKCIKQLNIKGIYAEIPGQQEYNNLLAFKGFKEYKFSIEHVDNQPVERKPLTSKLKPLKYQEFKMRDLTQKRIKRNMDVLFTNHSALSSERDKCKMLVRQDQGLVRDKKGSKQHMKVDILGQGDQKEYLLMRIREMKLQKQREAQK